jgi:hypothetical protein
MVGFGANVRFSPEAKAGSEAREILPGINGGENHLSRGKKTAATRFWHEAEVRFAKCNVGF